MQKLEEILGAEEAARHALADAREQSRAIIKDAEATAADLAAVERQRTAEEIASIERRASEVAQTEAAMIRTAAAADLEDQLTRARGRMSDEVERIVAELAG